MSLEQHKARVVAALPEIRGDLIELRRDLHAHPELGFEERRTSQAIQQRLDALGLTYQAGLAGGTGIVCHIPGKGSGAAVGLRADLDALPLQERATDRPWASRTPGVMHACGHDGHTTILVGVATILARLAEQAALPQPVTIVFQPAEEGGGGARRLVEEGCLDGTLLGPPICRMYGLHGWPQLPLGEVATRTGPLLAASDTFQLVIRGVGSHAGWPHLGRDPVVAAAAVVTALQTVASRNVDPLDAVVISVTQIQGGSAFNVIPATVELRGTIRTLRRSIRQLAKERMLAVAKGVAVAHGCSAELTVHEGYPATENHPGVTETARAVCRATLGEERVKHFERPVMGAEDFAYYAEKIPSCFLLLGLRPSGAEDAPELHQADFDFNDDALPVGVSLLTRLALEG